MIHSVSAMRPSVAFDTGLNALAVGGLALVLLTAYAFQFALGEQPCPLCTLQRVAITLAMLGFILNARFGTQPLHYAVILLSAAFGMVVSGRQVLLHVTPGTPHYGTALFGLHFYTWAFLLFAAMIPGTAALLALHRAPPAGSGRAVLLPGWVAALCWLGIALTLTNALTIFLQCGPVECSDDPVGWWFRGTNR